MPLAKSNVKAALTFTATGPCPAHLPACALNRHLSVFCGSVPPLCLGADPLPVPGLQTGATYGPPLTSNAGWRCCSPHCGPVGFHYPHPRARAELQGRERTHQNTQTPVGRTPKYCFWCTLTFLGSTLPPHLHPDTTHTQDPLALLVCPTLSCPWTFVNATSSALKTLSSHASCIFLTPHPVRVSYPA